MLYCKPIKKRWYSPGSVVAIDLEEMQAENQDDIETYVQKFPQIKYLASIISYFQEELISQWRIFYEIYFLSIWTSV